MNNGYTHHFFSNKTELDTFLNANPDIIEKSTVYKTVPVTQYYIVKNDNNKLILAGLRNRQVQTIKAYLKSINPAITNGELTQEAETLYNNRSEQVVEESRVIFDIPGPEHFNGNHRFLLYLMHRGFIIGYVASINKNRHQYITLAEITPRTVNGAYAYRGKKLCKPLIKEFISRVNKHNNTNGPIKFTLDNTGGKSAFYCYLNAFTELGYKADYQLDESAPEEDETKYDVFMMFNPPNGNSKLKLAGGGRSAKLKRNHSKSKKRK